MENKSKNCDGVIAWVVICMAAVLFSLLVYISNEDSRYIEKRDAWFREKINIALLKENSKDGEGDYYINIDQPITWKDGKAIYGPAKVLGEDIKKVRQSARNSFYDRVCDVNRF